MLFLLQQQLLQCTCDRDVFGTSSIWPALLWQL